MIAEAPVQLSVQQWTALDELVQSTQCWLESGRSPWTMELVVNGQNIALDDDAQRLAMLTSRRLLAQFALALHEPEPKVMLALSSIFHKLDSNAIRQQLDASLGADTELQDYVQMFLEDLLDLHSQLLAVLEVNAIDLKNPASQLALDLLATAALQETAIPIGRGQHLREALAL